VGSSEIENRTSASDALRTPLINSVRVRTRASRDVQSTVHARLVMDDRCTDGGAMRQDASLRTRVPHIVFQTALSDA